MVLVSAVLLLLLKLIHSLYAYTAYSVIACQQSVQYQKPGSKPSAGLFTTPQLRHFTCIAELVFKRLQSLSNGFVLPMQEELDAVPAVMALFDSSVAALRAKACTCFALVARLDLALLLQACQGRLMAQVSACVMTINGLKQNDVVPCMIS